MRNTGNTYQVLHGAAPVLELRSSETLSLVEPRKARVRTHRRPKRLTPLGELQPARPPRARTAPSRDPGTTVRCGCTPRCVCARRGPTVVGSRFSLSFCARARLGGRRTGTGTGTGTSTGTGTDSGGRDGNGGHGQRCATRNWASGEVDVDVDVDVGCKVQIRRVAGYLVN